jgi:hypothetical protein
MSANELKVLIGAAVAVLAWISFAEHPTARNLRAAIIDTFLL